MLLEIKNINCSIDGLHISKNINMSVQENSITALIGPNGSGKTTLFNIITGNIKPDSGEILLNNTRIDGLRPFEICSKGISRTYQVINLFNKMTLLDNVLVGMHTGYKYDLLGSIFRSRKMKNEEKEKKEMAYNLLEFVGLKEQSDNFAGNLSYGQQRLLEIVRAMASNPKILLLDEPAAGMNESEKQELNNLIRKIQERKITVLIVEHDMEMIMDIADRIYVIDAGTNLASGTPLEIQNNINVIKAYLGSD